MPVQTRKLKQYTNGRGGSRSLVSYLRGVDIFRDLTEEEIKAIHEIIPMRRCPKGTVFYRPGDRGERLFILKEGTATFYRLTPDGHKLVVDTEEAGTIFGEMALAGQSMRDCFAEAQEDAVVCTITRPDMERLLRQWPEVALRLLATLGRRIQALEERLEDMAYRGVRQRLVRFLLRQARRTQEGYRITGFSHEYLANAIGAARQTVTVELCSLENEGLVRTGRKTIVLINVEALRSIVDQD